MTTQIPQADLRIGGFLIDDVGRPEDLTAIHRQLCLAASAAGADTTAGESLTHAAGIASNLHYTWKLRCADPQALETARQCLRSLVAADLTELRYHDTYLPSEWIRQLQMLPHDGQQPGTSHGAPPSWGARLRSLTDRRQR